MIETINLNFNLDDKSSLIPKTILQNWSDALGVDIYYGALHDPIVLFLKTNLALVMHINTDKQKTLWTIRKPQIKDKPRIEITNQKFNRIQNLIENGTISSSLQLKQYLTKPKTKTKTDMTLLEEKTYFVHDTIFPTVKEINEKTEVGNMVGEFTEENGNNKDKLITEIKTTHVKTISRDVTLCAIVKIFKNGNMTVSIGHAIRLPADEPNRELGENVAREKAKKFKGAWGCVQAQLAPCPKNGPLSKPKDMTFIWDNKHIVRQVLYRIMTDMEENFGNYVDTYKN